MRFFKKENNLKFRKTSESKMAKEWMEMGWKECDKSGNLLNSNKKSNKK